MKNRNKTPKAGDQLELIKKGIGKTDNHHGYLFYNEETGVSMFVVLNNALFVPSKKEE